MVTLGKTGIQVSLVGMGTGSVGSGQASNQTRLGVKEFTQSSATPWTMAFASSTLPISTARTSIFARR